MVVCHLCYGSGKDPFAVAAASVFDKCSNCNGTGYEPVMEDDENLI